MFLFGYPDMFSLSRTFFLQCTTTTHLPSNPSTSRLVNTASWRVQSSTFETAFRSKIALIQEIDCIEKKEREKILSSSLSIFFSLFSLSSLSTLTLVLLNSTTSTTKISKSTDCIFLLLSFVEDFRDYRKERNLKKKNAKKRQLAWIVSSTIYSWRRLMISRFPTLLVRSALFFLRVCPYHLVKLMIELLLLLLLRKQRNAFEMESAKGNENFTFILWTAVKPQFFK